jgi:hypothetical protein
LEKFLSYVIVMALALLAVAIAYRVRVLHSIVFGKGSARVNQAAELSVKTGAA